MSQENKSVFFKYFKNAMCIGAIIRSSPIRDLNKSLGKFKIKTQLLKGSYKMFSFLSHRVTCRSQCHKERRRSQMKAS